MKQLFDDWKNNKYIDLAVGYAEKNEEEFEDYCYERYISEGDEYVED